MTAEVAPHTVLRKKMFFGETLCPADVAKHSHSDAVSYTNHLHIDLGHRSHLGCGQLLTVVVDPGGPSFSSRQRQDRQL